MIFENKIEAEAFGHKIGATHIKYNDGHCAFIRKCGGLHPIFSNLSEVDDYMDCEEGLHRLFVLGHMYHARADLLYIEEYDHWFAFIDHHSNSSMLSDGRGVEKLEWRFE